MPAGIALVFDQVMVPLPPLCVKVWLNAASTVPVVTPGLVTVMTLQAMTSVYVAPLPVQPLLSVAVTTMGKEPACVGVPARSPALLKVIPTGSVLAVENVVVPMPPLWLNC